MSLKSYLIGPYGTGLENDKQPWLLPEDAFVELEDCYVWRGRVKKRYGTALIGDDILKSTFRIQIDTTDGAGAASGTVPGATPIPSGGQQLFSIGDDIFTCNVTGTPVTLLKNGGSATTHTFDTTTGAYVFNGADATTAVYYYPGLPVMGLRTRELTNINQESTIGFDTQFAYQRTAGAWARLGTGLWTGSDTNFYWTCNYRSANPYDTAFYVVNYMAADNIQYIVQGSSTWNSLRPQLNSGATRYLETARIILPFKDRLILLNTIEDEGGNDRLYYNRCRFSQNGDPTAAVTAWLDDTPGRGGYIDAPTKQQIVTAQIIKDRLIVYFERSTWELVYTSNQVLPFRWQKISTELGAESTFSQVVFDKGIVGVGNVGIHACNGVSVDRIDDKIPNEVFKVHNGNDGVERVYGIRDFFNRVVLWTFPSSVTDPVYPNRILVYNYDNNTWAFLNDSFTCFGYYQETSDLTWADLGSKYGTWGAWNDPWNSSYAQSGTPWIIAGNQLGVTLLFNSDKSSNTKSMFIYDITSGSPSSLKINDHGLQSGDYILIEDCTGVTELNDNIYRIATVVDADNITLDPSSISTGTYSGGGVITRISNINILSKRFNPGTPVGQQFTFPYIDMLINRTSLGEVSLDYFVDQSTGDPINLIADTNAILGSNVLLTRPEDDQTFQQFQEKIWHRYYTQTDGQFIQLRIQMSDEQMKDKEIAQSDFEMHAMMLYVKPEGRLIG